MTKVTKEDLVTDIKDIKVPIPEEDKNRKEDIIKAIKKDGLKYTFYDSISGSYDAVYGILVRKYRGFNKFSGINIDSLYSKNSYHYLEKSVDNRCHETALLLLKLGANPNIYADSKSPLKECVTSYWSKNTQLAYYLMKAGAETKDLERHLVRLGMEQRDPLFLNYLNTEKGIEIASKIDIDTIFECVNDYEMLSLLTDKGVEICLDDGKALLAAIQNYSGDKCYKTFCFWLSNDAKFGDKRIEILEATVQENNVEIISKVLESEKYTAEEIVCNLAKTSNKSVLSILWKQDGVAELIQDKDGKWFLELAEHYIDKVNALMLEMFLEEPYSFDKHVDLKDLLLSAYVKEKKDIQKILWDCKSADYDVMELMNIAIEEGRWKIMKDIWKKFPDIDFTDAKQDALMMAVKLKSEDMVYEFMRDDVKVTPQMLQAAMPLKDNIMATLVNLKPYSEQAENFINACEKQDYNTFNTLIRPYFEDDELDWEVLDDNVIVHHQGYTSDRTSLKTIFNFAVDTVTMIISDQTNKTAQPVVTNMGFMQISNDDDIQKAHKKLKKFGKNPPENFETGAIGLGRKKTVMKFPK